MVLAWQPLCPNMRKRLQTLPFSGSHISSQTVLQPVPVPQLLLRTYAWFRAQALLHSNVLVLLRTNAHVHKLVDTVSDHVINCRAVRTFAKIFSGAPHLSYDNPHSMVRSWTPIQHVVQFVVLFTQNPHSTCGLLQFPITFRRSESSWITSIIMIATATAGCDNTS